MLLLGIGLGEDHRDLGVVAERDEHLRAGDRPAAVLLGRARRDRGRVRAGARLGQPEAAEPLARAELRQDLALLLLGAPLLDRARDERRLHGHDRARGGVAAADLLDDQPVADVVEAAAAVLLGDRRAEVAHLGDALDELEVEALGAVVLARPRDDLAVGEVARRLADQPLLVGEVEVHPPSRLIAPVISAWMRSASRPATRCVTGPGAVELEPVERRHALHLAQRRREEHLGRAQHVVSW